MSAPSGRTCSGPPATLTLSGVFTSLFATRNPVGTVLGSTCVIAARATPAATPAARNSRMRCLLTLRTSISSLILVSRVCPGDPDERERRAPHQRQSSGFCVALDQVEAGLVFADEDRTKVVDGNALAAEPLRSGPRVRLGSSDVECARRVCLDEERCHGGDAMSRCSGCLVERSLQFRLGLAREPSRELGS